MVEDEDDDEDDEFDLMKPGTKTGNLRRALQKGRLSVKTKILEPVTVRKQDIDVQGSDSEDGDDDVLELVSPRIGRECQLPDDDALDFYSH